MDLHAVAIDGTAIEVDQLQLGRNGVTLQQRRHSKQSGESQQSSQSQQSGQSEGSQQSTQSTQEDDQSDEVTIVFDEDVPPEERDELKEEIEPVETETQSKTHSGSKSQSSSQGDQSSQKHGKHTTVGFVPYDRLMYVTSRDNVVPSG